MLDNGTVDRTRGQFHPRAKLSDREVELVRKMHEDEGKSYEALAEKFEVTKACIQAICNYRTRVGIRAGEFLR